MVLSPLTAYFRTRLSARIFLIFTVLIIVVSLAFTVFFFRYQKGSLTERTVGKGEMLTRLLAYTVRLGVFTENPSLLVTPIDGIMENREVVSVSVYTSEGKILARQERAGMPLPSGEGQWDSRVAASLRRGPPSAQYRNGGDFVFWRRVELKSHAPQDDPLSLFSGEVPERDQVIGFVRVVLDGRFLKEGLHALLFDSILIGIVFLAIGSMLAYVIAARVTKPLKRLTGCVNDLGVEGEYRKIAVETGDEIGTLAAAFNNMLESLQKREHEKEELAEQLRHSQKMEAIGTLAGGVAHDFNNMLTAINGYASLIRHELREGDEIRAYADQIVTTGEKAAALTHRLLAFSRKQTLQPMPIDLNEVVKTLEKIFVRLITEDIELKLRLEATRPVVMADPGQLDQVLLNLVTNAQDAMPRGGALTIATGNATVEDEFARLHGLESGGEFVLLTVTDSGVGICDKVRERIFDPFFTTKEFGKGTGLGLSMVYGIVRQHDGIIDVRTEQGIGTSFRIYLPVAEAAAVAPQPKFSTALAGNGEVILVAEDDPAVMGYLKGMLENNGYVVIAATDGDEAVRMFGEYRERIDLALLDVIMPWKNGREVYGEIVQMKPGVRTVFMSGYTHDVIGGKDAMEEGASLILKPIRQDELLHKLRETLCG